MTTPTIRVKARWIIRDNDKILLCELNGPGFYCLPGGTLEPGETLIECLKRELFEELWVYAEVGKMIYMQDLVRESGTTVDVWYEITNPKDFYSIDLSQTTHGNELTSIRFFSLEELDQYDVKPTNIRELLSRFES